MKIKLLVSFLLSITVTACGGGGGSDTKSATGPVVTPPVDKPQQSPVLAPPQTAYYNESSNVIANPERGLQKYTISTNNLNSNILKSWRESDEKVTVAYRYFMLDEFMNSDISAAYLNKMRQDFATIRLAGLKVIVRFAYSNATNQSKLQQPSKARILKHISQFKAVMKDNKDVVYSIQAGFIGTWGEFYYTGGSTDFGDASQVSNQQWQNRKAVIDAMLSNFPSDTFIQVRYPDIKTKLYGKTALTASTAYKNTPQARIGFFNDAFLNEYGDQGSFSDVAKCDNPAQKSQQFKYLANEGLYTPITGETNKPGTANLCANFYERRNANNAEKEMQLTHWSVVNRDWYTPFWDNMNQAQKSTILKNLGYRFVLKSSTVSFESATRFNLAVQLKNTGFARLLYQRPLYLVIKDTANDKVVKKYPVNTDVRSWQGDVALSQSFDLNLPSGRYNLHLWLPDNAASLQDNPAYSIQFANQGIWHNSTGYNDLLQEIKIGKSS